MFEVTLGLQLARRALALLGIFIASCCACSAQAADQPPGPPPGAHWRGPGVERELDHLSRILSLTPEQQTQVKNLLLAQRQQMQALRTEPQPDAQAGAAPAPPNREKMEAIRTDTDSKIDALLNDDQKTKFAAWQQQRKQMMERHRGPGGDQAPPPPDAPNN